MSNVGKWSKQYRGVTRPQHYGDSPSYRRGADLLADCSVVEDWGCGLGWFRQFLGRDQVYRGLDGTISNFCTAVADFSTYRSETEGLYMRHVLEHNYDWETVLNNALGSFTKRFVLVTFTPFTNVTPHEELRYEEDYDVPTLALNHDVLISHFDEFNWTEETLLSAQAYYGSETLFVIDR